MSAIGVKMGLEVDFKALVEPTKGFTGADLFSIFSNAHLHAVHEYLDELPETISAPQYQHQYQIISLNENLRWDPSVQLVNLIGADGELVEGTPKKKVTEHLKSTHNY